MAARDFKTVDLGYSVKSLLAAEKAWAFLESHPKSEFAHLALFGIGWASIADEVADKVSTYQWVDTVDTAWGWSDGPTDQVEPLAAGVLNLSSPDLNRQVIHIELG